MGRWKFKLLIILLLFSLIQPNSAQNNNLKLYIKGIEWNLLESTNSYEIFLFKGTLVVNNPNSEISNYTTLDTCGIKLHVEYYGYYNASDYFPYYCGQSLIKLIFKPGDNSLYAYGGIKINNYKDKVLPDGYYNILADVRSDFSSNKGVFFNLKYYYKPSSINFGNGFLPFPLGIFTILILIPLAKFRKKFHFNN